MTFPIAVQPYTIREEMKRDYFGSLERLAEIGYKGVELGPPPDGITVSQLKNHLDRLGLQVIGCHAGLEQLTDGLETLVAYLQETGGGYVAHSNRFETRASISEMAAVFNRIGENCRKHGVQFLYHNHHWEFVKFDDVYAYDLLMQETDPELVKFELDTYWVKRGGEEPVEYINKLHNRLPLLHIKDVEKGEEQFFAEIGEGILDFNAISDAAKAAGTQWLVVEQDATRRSPFESLAISYDNMKKMNLI